MHTSETEQAICNCCGDCCYPIRASKVIETTGIWPKRRYNITFDADKCVDICHFSAFTKDERVIFDNEKCLGCTLCTTHCPVGGYWESKTIKKYIKQKNRHIIFMNAVFSFLY